ncbi:MAG TPA: hypothetical protein VFG10_19220 [Saprospiraceae bacterium]|nr:hypothetical protein [Saprospiraceae bacterium]
MKMNPILIFVLLLVGCEDSIVPTFDARRLCQVDLNGKNWQSQTFIYKNTGFDDTISIVFNLHDSHSIIREKLILFNIPYKMGFYYLANTNLFNRNNVVGAGYQTFISDGDVLGEQYYANNYQFDKLGRN